jgi:hypothetical protein
VKVRSDGGLMSWVWDVEIYGREVMCETLWVWEWCAVISAFDQGSGVVECCESMGW